MKIKKGQLLELEISGIAFGGKGIAKIDGLTVFVEKAVPMDRVIARIVKRKKQYAEARVDTLIEPSPFRINPPCIYSGFCGGCKWQFLNYDKQLEYKQQHVKESIERIGLIQDVPVHPTIPSPEIFEYRNKMEFSCSDRRWLLPDEMDAPDVDRNFALGLHVPGTFYKVIDTRECLLQPQLGNRILDDVRKFIRSSGVPVYGLRSHVGFWRFVMLRHSKAYDRWMVNIITAKENRKTVQFLADQLANTYPQIVSVVNNITSRKAGIAVGEYEILLSGSAGIKDKIGQFEFDISANSFFQTNTLAARRLYETVKEYAGLSGKETVVDLYSGTGAIAIFISGSAKSVIGMEIAESAVNDAVRNCRINGISNCRFILGDIKHGIAELIALPDVMIIDPPRAGMHKDVVRRILELAPARIIYVSCNPSTMARDLGLLKERYRVLDVQPVDMFPHTYHIESVAKLAKKGLRPLEVGGSLSAVVASLPRRSGYEGRKGYYFSRRSQGYFGEVCGEVGSLEVGGKRSEVRSRRTEISKEKIEKRKEAGATRLEVRGWRQDEGQMTESRGRRRDEIRGMMEEGRGAEVRNQISDVGSRED